MNNRFHLVDYAVKLTGVETDGVANMLLNGYEIQFYLIINQDI